MTCSIAAKHVFVKRSGLLWLSTAAPEPHHRSSDVKLMPIDLSEAMEHHRRGELDAAALAYAAALLHDPDSPEALHLLGLVTLQQGEPRRASALIGRAIAVRPDVAEYHASLGEVYWCSGNSTRPFDPIENPFGSIRSTRRYYPTWDRRSWPRVKPMKPSAACVRHLN